MGKVFVNKGLRLSKSAENGFGAASRAVLGNGTTLHCLNQITIIEQGGLRVGDDAHSLGVMKKVKGPQSQDGHGDFQLRRRDQPHCYGRGAIAENRGPCGVGPATGHVDDGGLYSAASSRRWWEKRRFETPRI